MYKNTQESRERVRMALERHKAEQTEDSSHKSRIYGPTRTETERTNQRFNQTTQTWKEPKI